MAINAVTTPTEHPQKWVDYFHNVAIVLMFLFLATTLIPVIPKGNRLQIVIIVIYIAIWAGLGAYDYHTNRLDQPSWMAIIRIY